jgi:hypothetical protein
LIHFDGNLCAFVENLNLARWLERRRQESRSVELGRDKMCGCNSVGGGEVRDRIKREGSRLRYRVRERLMKTPSNGEPKDEG